MSRCWRSAFDVKAVVVDEPDAVIAARYFQRGGRVIPPQHLSRQHTYRQRARQIGAFTGSAVQVIEWLRARAATKMQCMLAKA